MPTKNLIVYGAICMWWDSIDKAGHNDMLPCCPFCGGVLYQMEEVEWNRQVRMYNNNSHEGYEAFTIWRRGKCYRTLADAVVAYKNATGLSVGFVP